MEMCGRPKTGLKPSETVGKQLYPLILHLYRNLWTSSDPVLRQYYSVLQCHTPVLFRTTKYYSSTTPYYKVLLQYYSGLQCTTPVLVRTTTVLLCTT